MFQLSWLTGSQSNSWKGLNKTGLQWNLELQPIQVGEKIKMENTFIVFYLK